MILAREILSKVILLSGIYIKYVDASSPCINMYIARYTFIYIDTRCDVMIGDIVDIKLIQIGYKCDRL